MRILIDIGHPAHVHYFKNFISIMRNKGHDILITARDKEVTHQLLNEYKLDYYSRGRGKNSAIGKLIYMLKADWFLYKKARKFKPDYFLSFVSPYAAQVSWLLRKPHITFDDTEHANTARKFYLPFSNVVFTPFCFMSQLGYKQISFNGFMELLYLHKDYFKPDPDIYKQLGIEPGQPYVLLRFVSWNANHDIGQSGLDLQTKRAIIERLKDKYRVFICAEGSMPQDLEQYRIKISPSQIHDVLACATLFIGEGATMASECAMLGTPAIYVNSLELGYMKEQEKRGLICGFRSSAGVLDKIDELLSGEDLSESTKQKRDIMLSEMINPTKMLVDTFENYPRSILSMRINRMYQNRFK
ncbi:DUF354 domain-containing protein [Pedobacter sp. BS3]|uniref:DUF354 domain-containing protein n=1 Tax=Pedobacter sp. BS3 TaxID=2567937 RepID=UPI0011EC5A08|nr:DUF354 domain-containing protein [Pedobacter sp. BS3]TZF84448.1 DUF354 domain-containing protein [Pedobacter sp. BS3]